jgi:hypothetical protein
MGLDRDRVQRCLAAVDAYRASGLKAGAWAQANGVAWRDLASWCAHAAGWRAWLAGEVSARARPSRGRAAVAVQEGARFAPLPWLEGSPGLGAKVEISWPLQGRSLTLSWPLAHAQELAVWLRGLEP